MVGGDDTRLYYLFPIEYLKNFSFKVIANNTLGGNIGYMPVSFSAPIILFLVFFKAVFPHINTQLLAYGLILSTGFIFMYLFLQLWVSKKNFSTLAAGILASLSYVFSPFVGKTLFQNQQLSIFLVMIVPVSLFFFIFGVKKRNICFILVSSIVYSLFGAGILGAPWFIPVLFTSIPLGILLWNREGRYMLKASGVFIFVTVLLNVYWIIHMLFPLFQPHNVMNFAQSLSRSTYRQQNIDLISALSLLNSPVNQILGIVRTSWVERMVPTLIESYGTGILFLIFLAGTFLKKVHISLRRIYLTAGLGLIISMIFITPNFGGWNLWIFQILNDRVPLFALFKNMYDKFSLAISFHYAFALFVSLVVINESMRKNAFKYGITIILASIVLVRAYPFIMPSYTEEQQKTHISGFLNKDYVSLVGYISDMNTASKFLWYPMTYPGYVYIKDQVIPNHWYVGISPLQIVGKGSDIVGYEGIQTPIQPDLNKEIRTLLSNHAFDKLGALYRDQNIGYMIVNNAPIDPSYYDLFNNYDFLVNQTEEYKRMIIGEKIKDFGSTYSLHEIHSRFRRPTVFLMQNPGDTSKTTGEVEYQKKKSGRYVVTLKNIPSRVNLGLMEPYDRLWRLYLTNGNKRVRINTQSNSLYDYGNLWNLDIGDLQTKYSDFIHINPDGTYLCMIEIKFWPITITPWGIGVSVAVLLLSIGYIGYRIWKRN